MSPDAQLLLALLAVIVAMTGTVVSTVAWLRERVERDGG